MNSEQWTAVSKGPLLSSLLIARLCAEEGKFSANSARSPLRMGETARAVISEWSKRGTELSRERIVASLRSPLPHLLRGRDREPKAHCVQDGNQSLESRIAFG